jgi:hypothetical protein
MLKEKEQLSRVLDAKSRVSGGAGWLLSIINTVAAINITVINFVAKVPTLSQHGS